MTFTLLEVLDLGGVADGDAHFVRGGHVFEEAENEFVENTVSVTRVTRRVRVVRGVHT